MAGRPGKGKLLLVPMRVPERSADLTGGGCQWHDWYVMSLAWCGSR